MKRQHKKFILWVCPLLKPYFIGASDYVYKEGDDITESKYLFNFF